MEKDIWTMEKKASNRLQIELAEDGDSSVRQTSMERVSRLKEKRTECYFTLSYAGTKPGEDGLASGTVMSASSATNENCSTRSSERRLIICLLYTSPSPRD